MQEWPREIRVVHGEIKAKEALVARFQELYQQSDRPPAAMATGGAGEATEQDVCHE